MNPVHIDPETTWQERPEERGWYGTGDGYTVEADDDSFWLSARGRDYYGYNIASLADAVTEARDFRRLVMGH